MISKKSTLTHTVCTIISMKVYIRNNTHAQYSSNYKSYLNIDIFLNILIYSAQSCVNELVIHIQKPNKRKIFKTD